MNFRFKKASCVAVGTFNIYVLQPSLLVQLGIIKRDKSMVKMEANLSQPGFRFSSEDLNATWTVRPDRVIVETTDPSKDCGSDLAKVLEALRWTPLTAIGTNIEYVAEDPAPPLEQIGRLDGAIANGIKDLPCTLAQTTIHAGVRRDEQTFNLQIAKTNDVFELSCNVHADLKGKGSQLETSQRAQEIAKQFFQHQKDALEIVSKAFLIEISHEPNIHEGIRPDNDSGRESA